MVQYPLLACLLCNYSKHPRRACLHNFKKCVRIQFKVQVEGLNYKKAHPRQHGRNRFNQLCAIFRIEFGMWNLLLGEVVLSNGHSGPLDLSRMNSG